MVLAFSYLCFFIYCTYLVWCPSALVLFLAKQTKRQFPPRALFYWHILKWPALLGIALMWIDGFLVARAYGPLDSAILAIQFLYWVLFRNVGKHHPPPDRKRIRARVKQIGGRLVLVPETT